MDAKLKALKVADLKALLAHADVQAPARATKNDLVARILASQPALDAYAVLYPPADDLLAPPEEVDWDAEPAQPPPPPSPPKPAAKPPSVAMPEPAPLTASAPSEPAPTPAAVPLDTELEKRKARAARFGIPIVEPKPAKAKPAPAGVDPKKLDERAARFGIKPAQPQAAVAAPDPAKRRRGEKRGAPPAHEVDEEELARRKKRAERFGVPMKP